MRTYLLYSEERVEGGTLEIEVGHSPKEHPIKRVRNNMLSNIYLSIRNPETFSLECQIRLNDDERHTTA
jgi:hypothetical protein